MMRKLFALFLLLAAPVLAVDQVTITLTVTNIPQTGTNFVLNSDTRIFTNAHSASTILTNLVGIGPTTTNLFFNLSAYRHADLSYVSQTATNVIKMWANVIKMWGEAGTAMTVGDSVTNWASWTYATNVETTAHNIRVPMSVESATNQTNFASQLITGLGKASNEFLMHWDIMGQVAGLTNNNAFTGTNVFVNSHSTNQNIVNAKGISGTLGALTNGVLTNTILQAPTMTNGANYGNAFSSPGTATGAEQFGTGAAATTNFALAVGRSAAVTAPGGTAIGNEASVTGGQGVALGGDARANSSNALAIGTSSRGYAADSIAIGTSATIGTGDTNSIALGRGVTTTETNQILIGTTAHKVRVPGQFQPTGTITNATFTGSSGVSIGESSGTMSYIAVRRLNNTALANGENASVALNASYVKLSGPTAAFTTAGFTNSLGGNTDGNLVFVQNITGFGWTIRNDSGYESTPANRIYTMTGSDISLPGYSCATVVYDSAATRWIVLSTSQAQEAYGEIYTHDGGVAQTLNAVAATYDVLTNFVSAGNTTNTTLALGAAGSTITVTPNGRYDCSVAIAFTGDNTTVYSFAVHTNGTEAANLEVDRKTGTGADVGACAIRGILNLTTNCVVDVRAKGSGGANSLTLQDCNLTLIKIQ
jgi:hypothetical protein